MASINLDTIEKVPDNNNRPRSTPHQPSQVDSQLFEAVNQDDVKQLKQILSANPDGWKVKDDKFGSTLLHRAAGKGSKKCLRYILQQDSESVSGEDNRGCQPLHYASYNGHREAVQLLLENKANINAKNKEEETPLLAACLVGNVEVAKVLLVQHYEEDPSQLPPTDAANNTLLHHGMIGDHVMVRHLLEEMQSRGYTLEQLQQLVVMVNKAGQTILHIAAIRGQLETVQQYLSQLQLEVDAGVKDKQQNTCEDYARRCQKVSHDQNDGASEGQQNNSRYKSPEPLTLKPPEKQRTESMDSRVTPSTEGVNVLGGPVRKAVTKRVFLHKEHHVEVRLFSVDGLPPSEQDRSLAVNPQTDTSQKLELVCGLHGNILNKLPSDCHLISPIVMIKLGVSRPLMVRIIIPHALANNKGPKRQHSGDIKLFTVGITGVAGPLDTDQYTLDDSKNCIVTTVINKQMIYALTVMGKFATQTGGLLSSINLSHRPPAINCIYYVLSEQDNNEIRVKVYCAIDLPIAWKLLSDISKQSKLSGTFVLSHEHIDLTYQCVKHSTGWTVSNSSHKIEASSILPSPRSEHFWYPPSWEFKVFLKNVKNVSDKVTCKLLIAAGGKTELTHQFLDHDRSSFYFSKQSTPNSTPDLSLAGYHSEQFQLHSSVPAQCSSSNVESLMRGRTTNNLQLTNGHSDSQESNV